MRDEMRTFGYLCPKCGKNTRVGCELKDGKKVRTCKKSDCLAEFE